MNFLSSSRQLTFLLLPVILATSINAQDTVRDCRIGLEDGILSFTNSRILVEARWIRGDLRLTRMTDKCSGINLELNEQASLRAQFRTRRFQFRTAEIRYEYIPCS